MFGTRDLHPAYNSRCRTNPKRVLRIFEQEFAVLRRAIAWQVLRLAWKSGDRTWTGRRPDGFKKMS